MSRGSTRRKRSRCGGSDGEHGWRGGRGASPSAAARSGGCSTPRPSNPGGIRTGSSPATRRLPRKRPWCWTCRRAFGKANPSVPTTTSSVPMRTPASKPACGVTPPWRQPPAGTGVSSSSTTVAAPCNIWPPGMSGGGTSWGAASPAQVLNHWAGWSHRSWHRSRTGPPTGSFGWSIMGRRIVDKRPSGA